MKTKQKLLSILLAVVMAIGMLSMTALPVYAAAKPTQITNVVWNEDYSITFTTDNDIYEATYFFTINKESSGEVMVIGWPDSTLTISGNTGTISADYVRAKMTTIKTSGEYLVKVYVENSEPYIFGSSATRLITIQRLATPDNLHWEGAVAKWNAVTNANEYWIKLYSDNGSGSITKLMVSETITNTEYDFTGQMKAGESYKFKVIAQDSNYNYSDSAEAEVAEAYTVSGTSTVPTQITNVTWNEDYSITFTTDNDINEATYFFTINKESSGVMVTGWADESTLTISGNTGTISADYVRAKMTTIKTSGVYYVMVFVDKSDPYISGSSATRSITIQRLATPDKLHWEGAVAKWDAVTNADEYWIKLYSDNGSGSITKLMVSETIINTEYDFTGQMKAGESYKFKVIAQDSNYNYSDSAEAEVAEAYTHSVNPPAVEYDITVTNGIAHIGAGAAMTKSVSGVEITLTADYAPAGKIFDNWVVEEGGITVTNNKFTMPAGNVKVAATYKDAPALTQITSVSISGVVLPAPGQATASFTDVNTSFTGTITSDPAGGIAGGATVSWTDNAGGQIVETNFAGGRTYRCNVIFKLADGFAWDSPFNSAVIDGTAPAEVFVPSAGTDHRCIVMEYTVPIVKHTISFDATYTLTFEVNGGSKLNPIRKASGTEISLNEYNSTRDGYDFVGWYLDKELTTKIKSVKLTANTTVYAKWVEKQAQLPVEPTQLPFTDVKEGDWFYENVRYVYENNLMKGTSTTMFSPKMETSRGMIVTILYRLEKEPAVSGSNPFDDVRSGSYYENAITWAAANKIVAGYGNNKFGPDDPITREQMAAILYRYAEYKVYDVSDAEDLSKFSDEDKISTWATTPMKWAVAETLINGVGENLLSPETHAERCQVAAILHRFCNSFVK